MARGKLAAGAVECRRQRTGIRGQPRVEDEDGDGSHARILGA